MTSEASLKGSPVPMLELRELGMQFLGIKALDAVSFDVLPGSLHAVIGPNGAGKTTTMNCICGFYIPTSGDVLFQGRRLPLGSPNRIAEAGIARTFQHAALFEEMSVRENILCGTYRRGKAGFLRGALQWGRAKADEAEAHARTNEVMHDLGLVEFADTPCEVLPMGIKKRVDLARAVVQGPDLLLLDEPLAGLSEDERVIMRNLIVDLVGSRGATVVMIEHDMRSVMAMAHRITVLDFGRKIADGRPEDVRRDPDVIAAYLGAGVSDLDEA